MNKQPSINVNIDPQKIESIYSDAAFINHNPFGFTFDFGQSIPQLKMLKIVSRVSLSPQHAKALLGALGGQIKAYEDKFGEIVVTPAMQEHVNKGALGFKIDEKEEQ